MVSERLISRFEESLIELSEISGSKEKTSIITNLEVIDAAPGITGFIIVEDSKDGDYITAATIPGMIYANGDLVNILFIDGTEPIAYQHGSGSTGVAFAVDRVYRPDFTTTVLTGDNSNDVTLTAGDLIVPDDIIHSGDTDTLRSFTDDAIADQAGGVVMLRMTETAQDLVEIGDVAGGGDVDINFNSGQIFVEGSSGFLHIGGTSPDQRLHVVQDGTGLGAAPSWNNNVDAIIVEAQSGQNCAIQILTANNKTGSYAFADTDNRSQGAINYDHSTNRFSLVSGGVQFLFITSDGRVGIPAGNPSGRLHVDQSSTTAAIPVAYFDQADVSEEMFEFATTIGVGNAIEAVGAKTLTTTHFVKVTLPGGLTRYFPVGTIA